MSRSEQERLKHRARQAEDQVTGLRRQLDDRSREVEQLTTLSLKGDATIQEYMAQLTVSQTEISQAVAHADTRKQLATLSIKHDMIKSSIQDSDSERQQLR